MGYRNGFLRPRQYRQLDDITEGKIAELCPSLHLQLPQERQGDPFWGRIEASFLGHATNPKLRHQAASGGALSALVLYLLEQKEIDGIWQIQADPAEPLRNRSVLSTSLEEVITAAGSRYAPSAPLADIGNLLDSDKRYAVIAKPCDIAALRSWARFDPRIDQHFPWMFSFFCAGVPSVQGSNAILKTLGVQAEELVRFRYRGFGWPGKTTAQTRDGKVAAMDYDQAWGGHLTKYLQTRCKICPDGVGQFADISCADGWHLDCNDRPIFDERSGQSLIFARNAKSATLLQQAAAAKALELRPTTLNKLHQIQPGQSFRKSHVAARLLAMRITGFPAPRFYGFGLAQAARNVPRASRLRNFLGMARRMMKRRLTFRKL